MLKSTQWVNGSARGASGSSQITASDAVFSGSRDQESAGEALSPFVAKRPGMACPSWNPELVIPSVTDSGRPRRGGLEWRMRVPGMAELLRNLYRADPGEFPRVT